MSDCELLFSPEAKVYIPEKPLDVAKWLHSFGFGQEVTNIIKEQEIDGETFRNLNRQGDMKDLFPVFLHRKKLRDWAGKLESGQLVARNEESLSKESGQLVARKESSNKESGQLVTRNEESSSKDMLDEEERESSSSEDNVVEVDKSPSTEGVSRKRRRNSVSMDIDAAPEKIRRLSRIEKNNSLESSSVSIGEDAQDDILALAKKLKLVVPESVKQCRSKKEPLSRRARVDVIKTNLIVLQAAIGRNKPSQSEFELCAQQVVMLMPELKDPIPPIRQDAFKPWNTVVMLMKKAYYNRQPVKNPRKSKGPDASLETESTEEGHDEQLVKEMKKKKPDFKVLHGLLSVSLNRRRKWINSLKGKGTVKKILEKYPGFNSFFQIMIETALITGAMNYKEAWRKLLPALWQSVRMNFPEAVADSTKEELDEMEDDDKTLFVMYTFPRAWGLHKNTEFGHFIEEDVNFEDFLSKLNGDCHLIVQDKNDVPQCFVAVDNEVVVETDSYLNGLLSFFAVHQVFNLEYPTKINLIFKFLEEYVFGLPQKKKTMQYRDGVNKLLPP